MKEFITRTITTIVLIALIVAAVLLLNRISFAILIFLICCLAVYELLNLYQASRQLLWTACGGGAIYFSSLLGFISPELATFLSIALFSVFSLLFVNSSPRLALFTKDFGFLSLSFLYIFFPLSFLFRIKFEQSAAHLFFLIFIIAIGDSFAYFIGVKFGRHKIYPIASPKKSLEGLIAALISAGLFAYPGLKLFRLDSQKLTAVILSAVIIELFSQIADPVESLFKRAAGKKDSSSILPGHGGILDRIDSYLLCAPLFFFLVKYFW